MMCLVHSRVAVSLDSRSLKAHVIFHFSVMTFDIWIAIKVIFYKDQLDVNVSSDFTDHTKYVINQCL